MPVSKKELNALRRLVKLIEADPKHVTLGEDEGSILLLADDPINKNPAMWKALFQLELTALPYF